MFDFRYHVASLIAVFIALVIGILVGIGLSGKGFVSDAERTNLENRISELTSDRDTARAQLAEATRRQSATDHYADDTYPALLPGRLPGKRIAVIFVGSIDQTIASAVSQSVNLAGGRVVRVRALRVPIDAARVEHVLATHPALRGFAGDNQVAKLGRALGLELARGGPTPLLDALSDILVEERDGSGAPPADGVVIARSAPPQQGWTHRVLVGLYGGLAVARVPAVGVQRSGAAAPAVRTFTAAGLSTVDSVETSPGRLALVLELAGATPGHYGIEADATNGILPPVTAVTPAGG